MIYLRNIILLTCRFFINSTCKLLNLSFRLEFDFVRILEKNYGTDSKFYLIQVGANDGITHDSIYHFIKSRKSYGLVIEPLKEFFEKLIINYRDNPNIKPINKAVHAFENEITLYKINPDNLHEYPSWAQGLGSIDINHHKKSDIPSSVIIPEIVKASHLMTIVKDEYVHNKIDLILIDVEGYDYETLKMVDFYVLKPHLIVFEYKNLQMFEIESSITLLKKQGYYCFFQHPDLVGINLSYLKL